MKLSQAALERIKSHAIETYPDECCGLLVRRPDGTIDVRRLRNIQDRMHADDPVRFPRTARTAYYPDPKEYYAALTAAEAPGWQLAAIYHSHPDHDAYFSPEDARQATPFGEPSFPDALQIVISVHDRDVLEIKAYAWSPETSSFVLDELEQEEE